MFIRLVYLFMVRAVWLAGAAARAEVTDRMLVAGSRHLSAVLDEYLVHYNEHRPHRARNLLPPGVEVAPVADTNLSTTQIRRRMILGGLISEYEQAA